MNEDTYRDKLNDLQLEVEALRAKLKEAQTGDLISRKAALTALTSTAGVGNRALDKIRALPSAQPEPLTDKEQRIFLAAMGREEKVCEEVDRNYVREPYEDSLMRVCKEIRRKVKGALWT